MLINRTTGELATEQEQAACENRAMEILNSPYASPKQMAWAIEVAPIGFELAFWQSSREIAQAAKKVRQ